MSDDEKAYSGLLEDGSYVYGLYDKIGQEFYPSNGGPFTGE